MTTRLTLICHASTRAVSTAVFPGDEPIDQRGEAQAAAAAENLGRADSAWTSPTLRARQTAAALELTASVDPLLRDCDYGRWTGRAFADVRAQEPDAVAAWTAEPGTAPHGSESILDVLRRVATWLDDHRRDTGHTIVVTHPSVVRAAIIHAIHATPRSFWRIDVAPLSQTVLSWNECQWRLHSTGRVS